jgi:PTS system beta-glucosides-specific IIC component
MTKIELTDKIVECIGGVGNVSSVTHCITRLRLELKDESRLNQAALKALEGVQGLVKSGSEYQIVLGGKVSAVYDELIRLSGGGETEEASSVIVGKRTVGAVLLDYISGTILPSIPVLMGAGIINALLALINYFKILPPESTTHQLLSIFANAGFYFLPIILAVSGARKLKCNVYIAALVAGILIHPAFIALVDAGNPVTFLRIPVALFSYGGSITPVLLVVPCIYWVEKLSSKISPDILKPMLVPALTILIAAPVALWILAPLANIISAWIGIGIQFIYSNLAILGGVIIGGGAPFLVLTGVHNAAMLPPVFQEFSEYGYSMFFPMLCFADMSVIGAALGVALRTKNKKFKSLAYGAVFTGLMAGITEPSLFGVLLRTKRPFIAVGITSALCSALSLTFKIKALGFGAGGVFSFPVFFGNTFGFYVLCFILAIVLAAAIAYFIGFKDIPEDTNG